MLYTEQTKQAFSHKFHFKNGRSVKNATLRATFGGSFKPIAIIGQIQILMPEVPQ